MSKWWDDLTIGRDHSATFFHMLSPCLFWMYSAMFWRISPYMLGPEVLSVQTNWELRLSYDPPKKLGHPKNLGHCSWWFSKDRGRSARLWDPFIEKLGNSTAREGTLRAGSHVQRPAIHSPKLTHMMIILVLLMVTVMEYFLVELKNLCKRDDGAFGGVREERRCVTKSLESITGRSGGRERWYNDIFSWLESSTDFSFQHDIAFTFPWHDDDDCTPKSFQQKHLKHAFNKLVKLRDDPV